MSRRGINNKLYMMHRGCCHWLLLLITTLIASGTTYYIEQPHLELKDNSFRLSIDDDPDIKWVDFNVNINKEFLEFEEPQYKCMAEWPRQRKWSCEFDRQLEDDDIIYTWLMVQRNHLTYRDRKYPFSVGALRRGNRNYILTTTTAKPQNTFPIELPNVTSDGKTTTTSTALPPILIRQEMCEPSVTVVQNDGGVNICRGHLIFEDNFDEFKHEYWTNEIRIPSTRLDSEFVIYNGSVAVSDGILKISAALSEHGIKKAFDLGERCTAKSNYECLYEPRLHHFLPPITSGRINSAKHFNFKYGRIDVKAKVPKGDWLFPLIALQPSHDEYGTMPYANGEMRIAFVRGNQNLLWNNTNIDGGCLFGGPIFSLAAQERHQFMANITLAQAIGDNNGADKHFGDNFHVYSLTWKPNELLLSVDGMEYGKIAADFKNSLNVTSWRNKASNVPLDQMFYITLGLAAGGNGDFPENIQNKPWENTDPKAIKNFYKQHENWLRTWTQPTLEIDYVKVYAI